MIASLRDAEIEVRKLQDQINSITKSVGVNTTSIANSSKAFSVNPASIEVSGQNTSSGGITSYTPNTTPATPIVPIYDSSPLLTNLPTGLGTEDTGQTYYNSYFDRWWFWDGLHWHYQDGSFGAGAQCTTSSSFTPPEGGLWQVCDGSTVSCALANATIGTKIASHTEAVGSDNPTIEGGSGSTTIAQVAVAPTWDASAKTELTSLSVSLSEGSITVQSGTGANPGNGSVSGTVSPNPHSHNLNATNAQINPPSEVNGGLSLRISMAWWMRR